MKKFIFAIAIIVAGAALADKVITLSTARSKTLEVRIGAMSDGGCTAQACGQVQDTAGNVVRMTCTPQVELSGAGQTRCLNILSSGDALWRAQEGVQ